MTDTLAKHEAEARYSASLKLQALCQAQLLDIENRLKSVYTSICSHLDSLPVGLLSTDQITDCSGTLAKQFEKHLSIDLKVVGELLQKITQHCKQECD